MPRSLKAAKREDIEKVFALIRTSRKYMSNTKSGLEGFEAPLQVRELRHTDKRNQPPHAVSWIRTTIKRDEIKAEDIISEAEATHYKPELGLSQRTLFSFIASFHPVGAVKAGDGLATERL